MNTTHDHAATTEGATMTTVNGVFMGGGARGIAYAGALKAMNERNLVFGSVAGASAGAITASLLAAGMQPDQIGAAVKDALANVRIDIPKPLAKLAIPKRLGKAALGQATSLFKARGLRTWIDATLREQIGKTADGPVTFAELYDMSSEKIELYVVAMDLATGQPIVFCRRTTPNVEVAGAVASSSAIPGAFPGGRGVFGSPESGAVVHQLVDGGTWANYPAFVFQDQSFRAWQLDQSVLDESEADAAAWRAECERPIVGFVLGDPVPETDFHPIGFVPVDDPGINHRFDRGPTYTSESTPTFMFGALLSSDWVRFVLALALLVWVILSMVVLPIAVRRFSTWAEWLPDFLYPLGLIGTMAVVALAVVAVMTVASGLVITSRLLADTLIPSAVALIGVPTAVPPWVGKGDDAVVLHVPVGNLETIGFEPTDEDIAHAVLLAHRRVGEQLDTAESRRVLAATWGDIASPVMSEVPEAPHETSKRESPVTSIVVSVIASVLVGAIAWWSTNSAATSSVWIILLAMFVAFVVIVGSSWLVMAPIGKLAHRRSTTCVQPSDQRRPRSDRGVQGRGLVGIVCLIGAVVLSVVAMNDRGQHTEQARVVEGVDGVADNTYVMELDDGSIVMVDSERHFRLGERVFVHLDAERSDRAEIVGAVNDRRFAVVVVLWLLGLGFLTSAVRLGKWRQRCVNLRVQLDRWAQRAPTR